MRRLARLLACLVPLHLVALSLSAPLPAATNPDEILKDPALEQRARGLAKQLRCLVCQNQSIDDSDADLARDLRRIVREQLVAGRTDQEIVGFLTARYGDFVLLKPPLEPATWGLWFGPALVLLVGAAGIVVYIARHRHTKAAAVAPLSAEERARLDGLLRGAEAPDRP
jgi:cytochrome c-type biogenesis protein CcmH